MLAFNVCTLYIYLMTNTNANIMENTATVNGTGIARAKRLILAGDTRGLQAFNNWMERNALTQSQMDLLCDAFKTYYANK